jgi:aldose sugar dehydrogenase
MKTKYFPSTLVIAVLLSIVGMVAKAQESRTIDNAFVATTQGQFDEPWAFTFLPDGKVLVTEKKGVLKVHAPGGVTATVDGVPKVAYGGQGGFGDVILHPQFDRNGWVYLSYAEAGEGNLRGAAVARAKLTLKGGGGELTDLKVIWRQEPKVSGQGHYGHRLAFDNAGFLWISSGERQKFDPAQDKKQTLGKILRLKDDGSVPADNPFASEGGVTAQIWSLGHRNPLGIAFDGRGQLWNIEMGPQGGDELNKVERGANYGWPVVSNGSHYGGRDIPDHPTRPEFKAPAAFWNPSISPSSLMIYSGDEFPAWRGNAFAGGLSSQSLVRIEFDSDKAREAQRFAMGKRIRAVRQGPEGAIWLLEDGGGGRLLKLTKVK